VQTYLPNHCAQPWLVFVGEKKQGYLLKGIVIWFVRRAIERVTYCKVASSNMSRLEAHAGFFILLIQITNQMTIPFNKLHTLKKKPKKYCVRTSKCSSLMAALSSTSMKDWLLTKQTQDRAVGKCENMVGQVGN
jgi:hypothetical protein